MAFLDNLENSIPDKPSKKVQEVIDTMIQEPEFNKLMEKLRDSEEYDKTVNDGLALKIFSDFCCNGCSCVSEKDHGKQ